MPKTSFYKIYTADYTSEGYEHGVEDAKKHRPNSKFRFFKAVHPINCIFNLNNALDSYSRGYNQGYIDEHRVIHNIYNDTNHIKGVSMQRTDSYENHLQMVTEVKRSIASLKRYLTDIDAKYKHQIDRAESTGFMTNYTNTLKNKYQIFSQKINNLVNMIESHESRLGEQESRLQNSISVARD